MSKIPLSFYQQDDVVSLSRLLLGKYLFTCIDGNEITGGIITETEAYRGPEDKASHAYNNRRTQRNEMMYHAGGTSYVYLCYGIHFLFNIVTNIKEIPHAILIRSISPTHGIQTILKRRKQQQLTSYIISGPGTLTQGLGITLAQNGGSLVKTTIWLEDRKENLNNKNILALPSNRYRLCKRRCKITLEILLKMNFMLQCVSSTFSIRF